MPGSVSSTGSDCSLAKAPPAFLTLLHLASSPRVVSQQLPHPHRQPESRKLKLFVLEQRSDLPQTLWAPVSPILSPRQRQSQDLRRAEAHADSDHRGVWPSHGRSHAPPLPASRFFRLGLTAAPPASASS